jgi:hypothetical protein
MLAADTPLLLGDNLLPSLLLALGGALAVGNVLALMRPPPRSSEGDLARAPLGRSLVMIVIGSVAALWSVASLLN